MDRAAQPHGFVLDEDDERLLRGPVPAGALAWAAAAVGPRARVTASRPLVGGTSSAVHAVQIDGAELVLRRFVREDWLAREPDLAVREAAALRVLEGADLPTPRLVAVDPDGAACGVPAVLTTALEGRIDWDPTDVDAFLHGLAEALPAIHATPLPPAGALPAYRPYPIVMCRPPAWATRPAVWQRAIEILEGPAPAQAPGVFIHRDYHPGNVLWRRGRISGIVDWVNASIGSPWADVGHCRVNLASELGPAAADRFVDAYRAASGRGDDYHPYWDVVAAIGGLDEDADHAPSPADEEFLAAALARL